MEKAESGAAQLAKVERTLEGQSEGSRPHRALQEEGGALQTELGRLKAERDLAAGALTPERLSRYEALRAAKHGIAVGVLEAGPVQRVPNGPACRACQAIQAGPEVALCPNCHRILIVNRELVRVKAEWTVNTDGGARGNPGPGVPASSFATVGYRRVSRRSIPWPGKRTTPRSMRDCCGDFAQP